MAIAVVPGDKIIDRMQERAVLRSPRADLRLTIRVQAHGLKRLDRRMSNGDDAQNR